MPANYFNSYLNEETFVSFVFCSYSKKNNCVCKLYHTYVLPFLIFVIKSALTVKSIVIILKDSSSFLEKLTVLTLELLPPFAFVIFYFKKKQILCTMKTIEAFYVAVGYDVQLNTLWNIVNVILAVLIFLVSSLFYTKGSIYKIDFGNITKMYDCILPILLAVGIFFNFIHSTAFTVFVFHTFCTNCRRTARMIYNYGQKLELNFENEVKKSKSFSSYIAHFGKIKHLVEKIDSAFSIIIMFMYTFVFAWFFNAFIRLIEINISAGIPIMELIYGVFVLGINLFLIFAITLSASSVNKEHKSLKKALPQFNWKMSEMHCNDIQVRNFNLLIKTIGNNELFLSIGGMFEIKDSLIFTIFGMVCTYGIVVLQFRNF